MAPPSAMAWTPRYFSPPPAAMPKNSGAPTRRGASTLRLGSTGSAGLTRPRPRQKESSRYDPRATQRTAHHAAAVHTRQSQDRVPGLLAHASEENRTVPERDD